MCVSGYCLFFFAGESNSRNMTLQKVHYSILSRRLPPRCIEAAHAGDKGTGLTIGHSLYLNVGLGIYT